MKITRKISLALVLVMLLTMTLAVIPASAANIPSGTVLYLKPGSNWKQSTPRYAAYFFGSSGNKWVNMSDSDGDGIYEVATPSGNWSNVIFCRMNGNNATNGWTQDSQIWNQTKDLEFDGTNNLYTVADNAWTKGNGTWSIHTPPVTPEPDPTPDPEVPEEPVVVEYITVYFLNDWNWTNVACHNFGSSAKADSTWPGDAMTKVGTMGGKDVYSISIPSDVDGIVFTGTKDDGTGNLDQSPDIKEGLVDGAGWKMLYVDGTGNTVESITYDPNATPEPEVPTCTEHKYNQWGICTNEGCGAGTAYVLIGTLCSTGWDDVNDEAYRLTYNAETNIYTIVLQHVNANTYKFKVKKAVEGDWSGAYGAGGANTNNVADYELKVEKNGGIVTITIANGKMTVDLAYSECTDHNPKAIETTTTCTKDGETTYKCDTCLDTYTEKTKAFGHYYENGDCIRCDATTEYVTVYVKDTADWGDLYCYVWIQGGAHYVAWPGEEMTYDEATGLWSYMIPAEFTSVIFNKGDGDDAHKTADLTAPEVGSAYNIFDNKENKWTHVCDFSVPATCDKAKTCVHCGTESTAEADKALGHEFKNDVCIRENCGALDPNRCLHEHTEIRDTATCTAGGYKYTYCTDCHKDITPEADRVPSEPLPHTYDLYGKCACGFGTYYYLVGDLNGGWSEKDEGRLHYNSETGDYTITVSDLKAGSYKFKVKLPGTWDGAYGAGGSNAAGVGDETVSLPTDGCSVTITISKDGMKYAISSYALENDTVYYLVPAGWAADDAVFAIYYYDIRVNQNGWVSMTKFDGHTYYSATVPAGATHIIFVRLDPKGTEPGWDYKWNQSFDIAVSAEGGTYLFKSFGEKTEEDQNPKDIFELHSHNYKAGTPVDPTCVAKGYTIYTCESCGDHYESDFVDAKPDAHSYVHGDCKYCDAVLPAITEDGAFDLSNLESFKGVDADDHFEIIGTSNNENGLFNGFRDNGDSVQFPKGGSIQFVVGAGKVLTIVGHSANYGQFDIYLNGIKAEVAHTGSYTFVIRETTAVTIEPANGDHSKAYIKSISVETDKTIYDDVNVTFGSEGNYKSEDCPIDFGKITISDNGSNSNNSQVKEGSFTFSVAAGALIKIHGYPGYTSYTVSNGKTTTDNITAEYYYYLALEESTITVTPQSGNNYFYSIEISFHTGIELNDGVDSTCAKEGYDAYYTCGCHDGDLIPRTAKEKLPHVVAEDSSYTVAVLPTADANGKVATQCVNCHCDLELAVPALSPMYLRVYQIQLGNCGDPTDHYAILLNDLDGKISGYIYVEFDIDGGYAHSVTETSKFDILTLPTETTHGSLATKCAECDQELEMAIPMYGGMFARFYMINFGTCKTNVDIYTATIEDSNMEITGFITVTFEIAHVYEHTPVVDKAVAPKCEATGLSEGSHCSVCDEVLLAQTVVAATGHSLGGWVVSLEPTETETGIRYRQCSNCNHKVIEEIPELTHDHSRWPEILLPAVPATCTSTGLTEGKKCSGCNSTIVDQDVIPALPHTEVVDAAVAATCTVAGKTEGKHCSVCDTVIVAQTTIPAPGHTEVVDAAVAATCTETGLSTGKHCSVCNEVLKAQDVVPALGHKSVTDAAKNPTCTETGLKAGSHCSVCNETLVAQETVAALGHTSVVDKAVAPTCVKSGLTEGSHCSVCGETLVAQETVSATGHTEAALEGKAPTCTEAGLTAGKKCSVCNTVIVAQETIAALGHTEVALEGKAATCTEAGLTAGKKCSVCDTVIVAQETIAALGHTEVTLEGKAPTCTESGITGGKKCSACDTVIVAQNTIPATGHTFEEGKCACGAEDPDYTAPEQPGEGDNEDNTQPEPEQPEEELGFFEAIWKAILDFFASIGNFFAGLFAPKQ